MRIIAGRAKGRRLQSPRGVSTRPFTGRAREAVFSILGGRVVGARVLDLYAGSGSLGLEALSRGATAATLVEAGRDALVALRANVAAMDLGGEVVADRVEECLGRLIAGYDIVFVDPPYELPQESVAVVLEEVGALLAPGGVIVVHRRRGTPLDLDEHTMLSISDQRRYGDAEVWWLDKEER